MSEAKVYIRKDKDDKKVLVMELPCDSVSVEKYISQKGRTKGQEMTSVVLGKSPFIAPVIPFSEGYGIRLSFRATVVNTTETRTDAPIHMSLAELMAGKKPEAAPVGR